MRVPQNSFWAAVFRTGFDHLSVTVRNIESLKFNREQGYCLKQSHVFSELLKKAFFAQSYKGDEMHYSRSFWRKRLVLKRETMTHGHRTHPFLGHRFPSAIKWGILALYIARHLCCGFCCDYKTVLLYTHSKSPSTIGRDNMLFGKHNSAAIIGVSVVFWPTRLHLQTSSGPQWQWERQP